QPMYASPLAMHLRTTYSNCGGPSPDRSIPCFRPQTTRAPTFFLHLSSDKRRAPAEGPSYAPERTRTQYLDPLGSPPRADTSGCAQTHIGPRFSCVSGFVNAVSHHVAVAYRPRFAGPGPHLIRIRRRHCQRADRRGRFFVKHRLPTVSSIRRFPDATRRRARVIRAFVSRDTCNRRDSIPDNRPNESESKLILLRRRIPPLRNASRCKQRDTHHQ